MLTVQSEGNRLSKMRSRAARWRPLLVSLGLGVLTLMAYRGILHNSFLAEDFWQSQLLQYDWWPRVAFYPGEGGYRPLMYVSWAATSFLWGDEPFPYRALVALMHLFNACALYAVARLVTRSTAAALLAGALFLTFLPSAATVNWLSAASNQLLCAAGYLVGLRAFASLCLHRPAERLSQARLRAIGIAGLLIALASNEMALTWPGTAVVIAALVEPGRPRRAPTGAAGAARQRCAALVAWLLKTARVSLPFVLIWAAFLILRTILLGGIGGYGAQVHVRAGWFLINDLQTYVSYFTAPWIAALSRLPVGPGVMALSADHRIITAALCLAAVILARPSWLAVAVTFIVLVPAWNIPSLHRGYLVGAGLALMMATSFAYWTHKLARSRFRPYGQAVLVGLAAVVVGAQMLGVASENARSLAAGRWSEEVLQASSALVPKPAAGSVFYYLDLPQIYNGIYVFTWGLREAIQKHYQDRSLDAYQVFVQPSPGRLQRKLEVTLDDIQQASGRPQVFFVYETVPSGGFTLRQVSRDDFFRLARNASQPVRLNQLSTNGIGRAPVVPAALAGRAGRPQSIARAIACQAVDSP